MKTVFLSVTVVLFFAICANAQNTSPYWSLAGNSNVTSSSKLGTTNGYSVRFYTNNKQRMIINSDAGLVGIGTALPTAYLHVNSVAGTNAFRAQVDGVTKLLVHSGGGVAIGASATPPSNGLYVAGNVGIGTTSPSSKLFVDGDVTFTNTLYVSNGGITSLNGSGNYGIYSYGSYAGVYGNGGTYGVYADGTSYGIYSNSNNGYGVFGVSYSGIGGNFTSTASHGLFAKTSSTDGGVYAGVFQGNVYTYNSYVTSDQNLKKNISDFSDAISIINKLKPKNYAFRSDGKYASLNLPKGNHYGLLAQDLEQVLPTLVHEAPLEANTGTKRNIKTIKTSSDGKTPVLNEEQQEVTEVIKTKAVNYTELIPIVIKGMQEQDIKIQQQQIEITDLKNEINNLKSLITKNGSSSVITSPQGYLKQNAPNPSNNNTVISYYTPDDTKKAQILVTDMKGSVLKAYNVSKGEGQLNIRNGELPAGTYNYTLYINSNKIDTKKMIIIK